MPAPTPDQAAELLGFADTLAEAARGVVLPHFRTNIVADNKAARGFDPVTAADRACEQRMRAMIEAAHPGHGILGEEFGHKESRDGYTWYLDPIDGTRAFIAGLPLWGVLIGLAYEGRPLIGIIDQPYIGERFRGWPGGADFSRAGAARALRVRTCPSLRDAVASTTDPHLFRGGESGGFEHVRATAKLTRFGCDCYAYAMVAMGQLDLVVESGLGPWDVAALIPVLEGAGGSITNWRGAPVWEGEWFSSPKGRTQVIAFGDARVQAEALVSLQRAAS
jgi:histidinol phosphatase-like enzyme (inositol monophosphatase family)